MLETVNCIWCGFHQNYGRKNSLGSSDVEPDQGGSYMLQVIKEVHVFWNPLGRETPPGISQSGMPEVQKNEGGKAKGGNQRKLNLPSELVQSQWHSSTKWRVSVITFYSDDVKAFDLKMSRIDRLKPFLFLVKEVAINYHVVIWMPHIVVTFPEQVNSQSRGLLPRHFDLYVHRFEICQIKVRISWVGTDFSVSWVQTCIFPLFGTQAKEAVAPWRGSCHDRQQECQHTWQRQSAFQSPDLPWHMTCTPVPPTKQAILLRLTSTKSIARYC